MFASFHIPHHPDWLPSSPVLSFSSIFVIDGGTTVQSQSSVRGSPFSLVHLPKNASESEREQSKAELAWHTILLSIALVQSGTITTKSTSVLALCSTLEITYQKNPGSYYCLWEPLLGQVSGKSM